MDIFALLLSFHEKATNLLAKNVYVFIEEKIGVLLPDNMPDTLIDSRILEVFTLYEYHLKKPYYKLPIWLLKFVDLLAEKYGVDNPKIGTVEKIRYIKVYTRLVI